MPTLACVRAPTVSRIRLSVLALSPVARWIASKKDSSANRLDSSFLTLTISTCSGLDVVHRDASIWASKSARFTIGSIVFPSASAILNAAAPRRRCTVVTAFSNTDRNRRMSELFRSLYLRMNSLRKRLSGVGTDRVRSAEIRIAV